MPSDADPEAAGASLRSDYDLEAHRRTIRRAMRIGLWVWPSFTALDAYMCFVLYPGAPFHLFVLYRIAVEIFFATVHRAASRPHTPMARLTRQQNLAFFLASMGIAFMAVHLGGLRSAYMHGISLVCLVHGVMIPAHWRRSLSLFVPIGLVFPAVMGLTALLSPSERAEWFSRTSLAVFASHYVFVVASSVVAMVSGHAVWAAQRQVYRARQLGRYRLQAPLGNGGMGEVWLAWDASLRRNVALKLLRVNGASTTDSVQRFEREARAASRLRGPHTIHIYDFGASDDGLYYIAMEHLTGTDLSRFVRRHGPLPPARAVRFAVHACLSLEEAHHAGIIHRDIKPQNLFVTRVGDQADFLKLLDFGIARFQAPEVGPEITRPGVLAGTPAYMAPELWQGSVADERSDIYALGATLYSLLTGSPPFRGRTSDDLRQAHLGQEPERPSARRGEPLPERLEGIVLRCLAKAPEDRFQSACELRAALADPDA